MTAYIEYPKKNRLYSAICIKIVWVNEKQNGRIVHTCEGLSETV